MAKTKLEIQKAYNKRTNYASQKKYLQERSKMISFRVFTPQDDDIIKFLASLPKGEKASYFKKIIRADMQSRQKE